MSSERELLDACPIRPGMTVVRRGDAKRVRGVVKGRFVSVHGYRIRCRVLWSGGLTGARRLNGNAWGVATYVMADRLEAVSGVEEGAP